MMAMSKKMLDQEPSEIEMLLPWHAAGTLNARDARRVDEALASDPDLARQYAVIREEYAETIHLNESLGAPSARAMQKLFAAIDGEPVRKPSVSLNISARIAEFFASLSPRTLAWSASLGARGAAAAGRRDRRGADEEPDRFVPDRLAEPERAVAPITRDLGAAAPPRALVRFAPEARIADITALLDNYQASIVDGAKGGMFRLQFGNRAMGKDEVAEPDEQAARREDRQSRGGDAVRPSRRVPWRSRGSMVHVRVNWRTRTRRTALALSAVALPFAALGGPAAHAQSIMRSPNLNIDSRVPTINPTVTPRINPMGPVNPASADRSRVHQPIARPNVGVTRACRDQDGGGVRRSSRAYRTIARDLACRRDASLCALLAQSLSGLRIRQSRSDGECFDRPVVSTGGGSGAPRPRTARMAARATMRRRLRSICARSRMNSWPRSIGALSPAQADELARRHGLERLASQNFPLIGAAPSACSASSTSARPDTGAPRIRRRCRRRREVGAAQFPLLAAGAEEPHDRGRCRAICARPASAAAGPYAGPRHERYHCRDRFRRRRQTSRACQFGRRQSSTRSAARKARMSTAPALPARSWRMPG